MPAGIRIVGADNLASVKVTRFGQLVTAPLAYSDSEFVNMNVADTAFNLITPQAGLSVVITDVIVSADKSVSPTTPADIEIYQAAEADLTDVVKTIVRPQLTSASNADFIGLNLLVPPGRWVNAKTDDNNVLVTIMFYRVPVEFV